MSWDYADLSKMAKEAGGPDGLVKTLIESGVAKGHKEMIPIVVGVAAVTGLTVWSVNKVKDIYKKNIDAPTPEQVEQAKSDIINGIKEYDDTHMDDKE